VAIRREKREERREMSLSQYQKEHLLQAIEAYAFPAEYFDFIMDRPEQQQDTRAVEAKIKADLICGNTGRVKNGLSNVLYWGFSQMGFRWRRVSLFRANVTTSKLEAATQLFHTSLSPPLTEIGRLMLPQFSGVSFVSKIRMFLDPEKSATLDLQIMKIRTSRPDTVLANVCVYETRIPITAHNAKAYELWCRKMREISTKYFAGRFRAADVERGFFQLIQDDEVSLAGEILGSA
jgi:hypothetical protein